MKKIVVSRDRISELPNDLLINILSLISTKEVLGTMVLSKQWRFIWTMVPKIEYEDTNDDCERLCRFLDKSMELHNAPVLETLSIRFDRNRPMNVDAEKWVSNAVDRFVCKLEIEHLWTPEPTSLPRSLYTCTTLVELTLWGNIFVDVPSSAYLPSLKILHLFFVVYKDEDSFAKLSSSCSVIARSVIVIVLSDSWKNPRPRGINIPFGKPKPRICVVADTHDNNILKSISLATSLSLVLRDSKAMSFTGITFSSLLQLTLFALGHLWLDLLALILDKSPKLAFLKISSNFPYRPGSIPLSWKTPNFVHKCFSSCLETFEWKHYKESEENKELMRYIFANAKCLEKAKIIFHSTYLLVQKGIMETEIKAMPRVSTMSQLLFE